MEREGFGAGRVWRQGTVLCLLFQKGDNGPSPVSFPLSLFPLSSPYSMEAIMDCCVEEI